MSRMQLKRRTGGMAQFAIVGFFILLVACGVGFSVASAEVTSAAARTNTFGFDETTRAAAVYAAAAQVASDEQDFASGAQERTQAEFNAQIATLGEANPRTLDAGFQMIDEQEALEARRLEEEKVQALARVNANKWKQGVRVEGASSPENGAEVIAEAARAAEAETDEYGLSPVDWTVGKEAFVAEWTARIDAYLKGSNLAGYGAVFAETAWTNGVDPRWSPAISNTESTKGRSCFLPYNAWGWGSRAWSNWTTAIVEHVAGLADDYGYSLTETAALKYCPPTYMNWYKVTLAQMRLI